MRWEGGLCRVIVESGDRIREASPYEIRLACRAYVRELAKDLDTVGLWVPSVDDLMNMMSTLWCENFRELPLSEYAETAHDLMGWIGKWTGVLS